MAGPKGPRKKGNGHTSEVTAEHEIKDKKAIFIVLKCISEVHYKGVVDLFGRDREGRYELRILAVKRRED